MLDIVSMLFTLLRAYVPAEFRWSYLMDIYDMFAWNVTMATILYCVFFALACVVVPRFVYCYCSGHSPAVTPWKGIVNKGRPLTIPCLCGGMAFSAAESEPGSPVHKHCAAPLRSAFFLAQTSGRLELAQRLAWP